MDARQLRYFLAVIDHGGFIRMYVAQPSLSQAIAGFERELGVPLFHRVGRGVVPTDALPGGPFQPDARETSLIGPGRTFSIGMPLQVKVGSTDELLGRIEFSLAS